MLVVGSLLCLACNDPNSAHPADSPVEKKGADPQKAKAAAPPAEDYPSLRRTAERQGLSADQQWDFFHLAEGSEVFPLSWLRALETPGGTPFLQNVERFGLLPDSENQDGLPIGITAAETRDLSWTGMRMIGVNCAACHVGQVTYQGKQVRVTGAPNQFDVELFFSELVGAVQATTSDWEKLYRFVATLVLNATTEPVLPTEPDNGKLYAKAVTKQFPDFRKLEQGDLFQAEMANNVKALVIAQRATKPRLDLSRSLKVNKPGAPVVTPVAIRADFAKQLAIKPVTLSGPLLRALPQRPDPRALFGGGTPAQVSKQAKGFLSELLTVAELLKARAAYLKNLADGNSEQFKTTKAMFGRVDAFNSARNLIFTDDRATANSPVSYPHLWGMTKLEWVHWDGSTNSLMERNMGQALGLGAVFNGSTGDSTLLPKNLHRLETVARAIEAPPWPVAVFGAIDPLKVERGKTLFGDHCSNCHTNEKGEQSDRNLVKTDPDRADSFARTMKDGRPFSEHLAEKLAVVKQAAYTAHGVSPEEQKEFEGDLPPKWKTTGTYAQRTLTAVWATAPYLHNGSVSSVYELLLKPADRKPFFVGVREYDPKKLGLVTTAQGASAKQFDPRVPGNGNGGHDYGTGLTDEDRYALIEYLKTL